MSGPNKPKNNFDKDSFKEDDNTDAQKTTSMGHSSGTQQIFPRGGGGVRPGTPHPGRANNTGAPQGNNGFQGNFDALNNEVLFFGVNLKVYHLLVIAVVAFYIWGAAGPIGLGIAYWISTSFQQQAPQREAPQQQRGQEEETQFRPINQPRQANPNQASNEPPKTDKKFPGQGYSLR